MSVIFSKNPAVHNNGYFRIGFTILDIPPQDISTTRIVNNDSKVVLRGRNNMYTKSGQARWDISVKWTAIKDTSSPNAYYQYEQIRDIIAYFKASPFIEIENSLIRQTLFERGNLGKTDRIAVAMRQLRIDTHPDIQEGLVITLVMTFFNYNPYSKKFSYYTSDAKEVDAYKSDIFKNYINTWKSENLVAKPQNFGSGNQVINNWESLDNKTLSLFWKSYTSVSKPQENSNSVAITNSSLTGNNIVGSTNTIIPDSIKQGNSSGWQLTTGMNAKAIEAAKSWLGHVASAGYSFTITSGYRSLEQQQILYTNFISGKSKYPAAKPGHSNHEKGLALDVSFSSNAAKNFAINISSIYGYQWFGPNDAVHFNYVGDGSTRTQFISDYGQISNTKVINTINVKSPINLGISESDPLSGISSQVDTLVKQGYIPDHRIEQTLYLYTPQQIDLTPNYGTSNIVPIQLSILFINNLPQIPLASYQYPTYQHISSISSFVSLQVLSKGVRYSNEEPQHSTITSISSACKKLEDQYLQYRTSFRNIDSIHSMQALWIKNKIFNMCGIYSIMPDQFSVETVQEFSDTVQANLSGFQYENIFEEISPFKINGAGANQTSTAFNSVISSNMSKDDEKALNLLSTFRTAYINADIKILGQYIAQSNEINSSTLSTLENNSSSISLSSDQLSKIKILLSTFNSLNNKFSNTKNTLAINVINNSTLKVSDLACLIYFDSLTSTGDSWLNNIKFSNSDIQSLYLKLFPQILSNNPLLKAQIDLYVQKPVIKDLLTSTSTNDFDINHGCYRDFGIQLQKLFGKDFNPSVYFKNDYSDYRNSVSSNISTFINSVNNTSNQVNNNTVMSQQQVSSTTSVPLTLIGNADSLSKSIVINSLSMKEAFPTFKLFFMEDNNDGVFYAFDNFYSYGAVQSIEIIRNYNTPATAQIKITNLSHLLNYTLMDGSMYGNFEKKQFPHSITSVFGGNGTVSSPAGTNGIVTVTHNAVTGETFEVLDYREGYGSQKKLVPLKYFPLQTGTKIQIRMGFENDPDKLTPVFVGQVTELEGGDEIIITAQSYLTELLNASSDSVGKDSWLSLDSIKLDGKGAAYGGWSIFGESGSASNIIRSLLKNSAAKHFGHWQINPVLGDNLLQGFNFWVELTNSAFDLSGNANSSIGTAVAGLYDRSGDNIMVNFAVNYQGSIVGDQKRTREYYDQRGQSISQVDNAFTYHIPDSGIQLTIWDLVKDVSRRIPEYLLLEKWYGFPNEANSTLVYANPLDWYYSRSALLGDAERQKAADASGLLYQQWFNSQGKVQIDAAIKEAEKIQGFLGISRDFNLATIDTNLPKIDSTSAASGPDALYSLLSIIQSLISGHSSNNVNGISKPLYAVGDAIDQLLNNFTFVGGKAKDAAQQIDAIKKSYQAFVQQNTTINYARIQPVRKYHLIDENTIIKNDIRLNDKIINQIKIDKKSLVANQNIPPQHRRALDVTNLLVEPEKNVIQPDLTRNIAQSFLKEEIGKMYRGEIILRGCPQIEPMDVLMIVDPSTGMVGPVEVEQVIHSMDLEYGFISIVTPRCMVVINESVSGDFVKAIGLSMAKAKPEFQAVKSNIVGAANLAGNLAINETVAVGTAFLLGATAPELLAMSLLAGGLTLLSISEQENKQNLIYIQPLSRFNKPWIAGLAGYKLSTLIGGIGTQVESFLADTIYPFLDLWKQANGITQNF